MHNAIVHHLLTNAQPIPQQWSAAPSQLPPVYAWDIMCCGLEYPFGQFRSAVLAMLPRSFLCLSSLAENGTLNLG